MYDKYRNQHSPLRNFNKSWEIRVYKLLKNPICLVPVLLFVFICSLYFTLQSALHESYFASPIRFESHENFKYTPIEFKGERIVHIDLKGAPPRMSYFKQILPVIAKLGATGLLIEYEDTFPFQGHAAILRSHSSYTVDDIKTINNLAKNLGMSIIPLVQSFGHLEYILKLRELSDMREVVESPRDICPNHPHAVDILFDVIEQVILSHPLSTMIHIGADEILNLGKCNLCKKSLKMLDEEPEYLFLRHLKIIAKRIKDQFPNMTVLAWDDQFRTVDVKMLLRSNIRNYIQPVIWNYNVDIFAKIDNSLMMKYKKVFHTIWLASSFKGATGSDKYLTQPTYYIKNQQSWLEFYRKYQHNFRIQGIFLTGWQRYDHFAVLCELLPVSIPSLSLCLALLKGKDIVLYSIPKEINEILKCQRNHAVTFFGNGQPYCMYPGGTLLDAIIQLHEYKSEFEHLKKHIIVKGWLNNYNVKRGYCSPHLIAKILPNLINMGNKFDDLAKHIYNELLKIYFESTAKEWLETHVESHVIELNIIINNAQRLLNTVVWEVKD